MADFVIRAFSLMWAKEFAKFANRENIRAVKFESKTETKPLRYFYIHISTGKLKRKHKDNKNEYVFKRDTLYYQSKMSTCKLSDKKRVDNKQSIEYSKYVVTSNLGLKSRVYARSSQQAKEKAARVLHIQVKNLRAKKV